MPVVVAAFCAAAVDHPVQILLPARDFDAPAMHGRIIDHRAALAIIFQVVKAQRIQDGLVDAYVTTAAPSSGRD